MHSLQQQKELIIENIDNLECIDDTLPLLTSLFDGYDIADIQSVLKQQIEKVVNKTMIITFYETLPIDQILPLDVIQKCISFIASNDINLVSKQFKELDEKNQALREQERLIAIKKEEFVPNITVDESSTTWIVRKLFDKPLNDAELKQGYKLTDDLEFALLNCAFGDVLQIVGYHYCNGRNTQIEHANISIIGIGDDATIDFGEGMLRIGSMIADCVVHMKNIELQSSLFVGRGASLWIEECRLLKGIDFNKGVLNIRECVFSECASIEIHGTSGNHRTVTIVGCLFQNDCDDEDPCICIRSFEASDESDLCTVSLKCIGNIFKNKATYPIYDEKIEEDSIINMQQTIIENNLLKGRNMVDDANKIYRLNEEEFIVDM